MMICDNAAVVEGDDVGGSGEPRLRLLRLGPIIVQELVELIVTGALEPGQSLPPEGPLSEQFGVSRTVIRESVKRLEEKGLVVVTQGRGTHVTSWATWNMLDPVVLSALIDNDASVGILDELTVVRASLESVMAGEVARRHTDVELTRLHATLTTMRETEVDEDTFFQADVVFHYALMDMSGNRLAQNIAKSLYRRALESPRYRGRNPAGAMRSTLEEHTAVYEAIAGGRAGDAEQTMRAHIETGWKRRRLSARQRARTTAAESSRSRGRRRPGRSTRTD
jgi:DNA-binding FadR family transcriptional regulator